MKPTLANLFFAIWNNRELILATWPLVLEAQRVFSLGKNEEKKAFVTKALLETKKFTSDNIDKGIDAVVQLLQLVRFL